MFEKMNVEKDNLNMESLKSYMIILELYELE